MISRSTYVSHEHFWFLIMIFCLSLSCLILIGIVMVTIVNIIINIIICVFLVLLLFLVSSFDRDVVLMLYLVSPWMRRLPGKRKNRRQENSFLFLWIFYDLLLSCLPVMMRNDVEHRWWVAMKIHNDQEPYHIQCIVSHLSMVACNYN